MANKIDRPESDDYILIDEDRIPIYTGEHDDHSYMWYGISDGKSGEVNFKVHISIDEDDSDFLHSDFHLSFLYVTLMQNIIKTLICLLMNLSIGVIIFIR